MALLSKIQRDIAVCAMLVCPHCDKASRFMLKQIKTVIFGLPMLDLCRAYQLGCSSCSFRKDLEPRELLGAMRAKRLFSKLKRKEIDPQQYLRALEALKFPALRELQKGAKTWNCPACAEKVPDNFNICWKCAEPRSDGQNTDVTDDTDPPKFPNAIVQSPNPWER